MNIEILHDFFLWSTIINVAIYMLVSVSLLSMRGFYIKILKKVWALDEEELLAALGVDRQEYLLTEDIKNCAYDAKAAGQIGKETLIRLLAG